MGRGPIIKELSREFEVEVLTNPSNERILVTACPGRGDTGPFPGSHPGAASSTKSQSLPAVEVQDAPAEGAACVQGEGHGAAEGRAEGVGGVGERWQGSLAGPNREGAGVPRGTVGLLQVGG